MSGGHWGYFSDRLNEAAEDDPLARRCARFLAVVEHELDWGICCDTCKGCAERRVMAGLSLFFDGRGDDKTSASVMRDHDRVDLMCDKCLSECHHWKGARWTEQNVAEAKAELARRTGDA